MKKDTCQRCDGFGVVAGALCAICHGAGKVRRRSGGRIVGSLFINAAAARHVFMPGVRP